MQQPTMQVSRTVIVLSALIALLALIAAGTGLFWQGDGSTFTVTSVRGEEVELYGWGLYYYDTVFKAAGNRGTDAVTLVLAVPLLILSLRLYWRGSLKGGLLLLGALAYFLYVYTSVALGTTYNDLFLVYIALFSASLFAFVLMFSAFDREALAAHFSPRIPRVGLALFMFASGLVTAVVWLGPLLGAQLEGRPPELLDTYSTSVTDVLDLGVITPATLVAGLLILRRDSLGYLVAFALLVVEVSLAPMIAAQTISQISADVSFTTGEIVGPMAGFVVLALLATGFIVALLRNIAEETPVSTP